jgi:hypothetical protein
MLCALHLAALVARVVLARRSEDGNEVLVLSDAQVKQLHLVPDEADN